MTANLRESEFFDLRLLAKTVISRALLIVVVTSLFIVLAGVAAALKTPKYRAVALLSQADSASSAGGLADIAGRFGGLASLAGVSLGGNSNLDEAIATASSNAVVGGYIEKNDLVKTIFEKKWDHERQVWRPGLIGSKRKAPTTWQAVRVFRDKILILSEDKRTHLVQLIIQWNDPVVAARWANDLVAATNDRLRSRAIEISTRNLQYLNEQMDRASTVDMRQAIARLIEAETKTVMVARGNEQYALKILDPAVVPEEKYSPSILMFMVSGALLGIVLGCGLALVLGPRD